MISRTSQQNLGGGGGIFLDTGCDDDIISIHKIKAGSYQQNS